MRPGLCFATASSLWPSTKSLRGRGRAKAPERFYAPRGCLECRDTGFLGRVGVYELLPMNEAVKPLIGRDIDLAALRRAGLKEGMRTLRLAGAQKIGAGLTTVTEVLRVAPVSQES